MTTRRNIILGAGIATLGLAGYTYRRGLRLPTLHFDPLAIDSQFSVNNDTQAIVSDLIKTPTRGNNTANFRAFAPEPSITLLPNESTRLTISVDNISPEAELAANLNTISETSQRCNRTLVVELTENTPLELRWVLPTQAEYHFASIGDTGGDKELYWCIQRAEQLGAKFLLHLGDFNYQDGDYDRAVEAFNNSPIPIYISIGNHDFHDDGAIYQQFLRDIGPLNNAFSIGKTRFANIDTAANVFPYGAGQRGEMFERMRADNNYADTVAFTHCPLQDPDPTEHHDIGSDGERDWLIESLKQVGAKTLLSGHVHVYDRADFQGIDNIIVGQGLGHQDLLINADASKMILGHVNASGIVDYTTAPLAMPLEAHCHPRSNPVKESLRGGEHQELLTQLERICNT